MKRLLACVCLLLLLACRAEPGPDWDLYTVTAQDLHLTLQETGELGSAEETALTAPFDGVLTQLIPEGSVVKKGDALGRFDTATQQQERDSAKLSLDEARLDQQLARLEQDWRQQEVSFQRRQAEAQVQLENLRLRQLKEERDTIGLTRSREGIKSLQQRTEILNLEARERSRLFELGYLSREEREQARLQLEEAARERERLEAELKVLEQGARPQDVKKQQLQLQQARDRLRQLQQEAQVQAQVAQVMQRSATARAARYDDRLRYYSGLISKGQLKAPVGGTVIYGKLQIGEEQVPLKAGDSVKEGMTVMRLVDLARPMVRVAIHEIDAPRVKQGQAVTVRFDAWPALSLPGKVQRLLPVASQSLGNDALEIRRFDAEILLAENDDRLRPGMTASVEILTEIYTQVLAVPSQAVIQAADQHFCWVLSAGQPRQRAIETGPSDARQTLIRSGLSAGEQVILNPAGLQLELPAAANGSAMPAASTDPAALQSATSSPAAQPTPAADLSPQPEVSAHAAP